jgi:hypothetical protein
MTQDEIIEMAVQAGMAKEIAEVNIDIVEAFAKLVAAKEREACAELRNKFHPFDGQGRQEIIDVMNTALDDYQAAIRARGQA